MMDINDLLKDEEGNSFIDMNNHSDWIKFFFIFSRFEYALKRTCYISPKKKYVEADWCKFGKDVKNSFYERVYKHKELADAISYFASCPPRKQILRNNQIAWEDSVVTRDDIQTIIVAVKTVRNNLFHGGKYPSIPVEDPSRNNELMRHSITVLNHLLHSSENVKSLYKGHL